MPNPQNMTMVVARYNEDLNWLKKVPWDYIVYNKGNNLPKWVKNEIKLQNIGREAHSYLTYIIDNYDNLPDYTIFVQGNPFDHSQELIKKIENFDEKAGFFPLSDRICVDKNGDPGEFERRIFESVQKIFLKNDIKVFKFPMGAQFIVSKKAILFHTKTVYQKTRNFMIETENIIDEKDTIFSPWVMERLWQTLFDNKHKTIYD